MLEQLTERLQGVFRRLSGRGTLTEANVAEALREVRQALLAADVNYKVARDFVARIKEKALGQEVLHAVSPGQQMIKVVHDALVDLMGPADSTLARPAGRPAVYLLCGLQGSGKTTTCAKLALSLRQKGNRPLLVACDLRRPAAIDQLQTLGKALAIPVHVNRAGTPRALAEEGIRIAGRDGLDTVIVDTAGRLHVDGELMDEVADLARAIAPDEVLFVCDAMTGQDAVTSAEAFHARLPLTGVILTKLDGDARGGAALSVRAVTGRPIKFAGTGEKTDRLEPFDPERMAARILGMGDVVGLVERAQEAQTREEAEKMQERLLKATFTLEDLLQQLRQLRKMGSFAEISAMLPGGLGKMMGDPEQAGRQLGRYEAILQSMTATERRRPEVIDGSRRRRIASGSGSRVEDVNDLLREYKQMKQMMKQIGRGGLRGKMKGMPGMPRFPGLS